VYSGVGQVNGNWLEGNQATPVDAGSGGGIYIHSGDLVLSGNTVIPGKSYDPLLAQLRRGRPCN
jgi:hypothetical protein